jgi:prepilin signal peptidase PulO-like enzyme (type II secretory pathway)
MLRGRCRHCQAQFSSKYFWIEFFFASSFALLWILEVVLNVNRVGLLPSSQFGHGLERELVAVFAYHAFLLGTVLIANLLAWQGTWAHWSLFAPAFVVGLAGGTLGAWPWPCAAAEPTYAFLRQLSLGTPVGLQPTSPWSPIPEVLVPYSYTLGIMNGGLGGLVGLLGMLVFVRFARLVAGTPFRGAKGDILLATTCGVFIGWQGIVLASAVGILSWLLVTPLRRWLAGKNRFTPIGWWVGWASLVYLVTSHWVLGPLWRG